MRSHAPSISHMASLFLGIDSGTQSTKVIVLDLESGEILTSAHHKYGLIEGLPAGHLEQHPSAWIEATDEGIAECVAALGVRRKEIKGIGVSGQQHGLVVLNDKDEVIRPAKLWCDTSTAPQCDQIAHEFGGQPGCISLTGNAVLPGYTIPKVLWLKQNEPESFKKTRTILLPHDYLNFWLTGVKRMEYGDASGTGVFDVRQRAWNHDIANFVDGRVLEMLPEVGSSQDVHGTLKPELAKKWGISAGVIVSAGGGDNMMGAIGTGNIKPGVISASFGTSGTLYGVAAAPVVDGQGEVAAFCDSTDQWLPLVCTMNVTVVTSRVCEMFGWSISQLEAAVQEAEAGAGGLVFLPYLNGERTPNLPDGSGVLHGLRPGNMTPQNIARAAVEGATLGLAYGLTRFRELGMDTAEIRLTGGGSQSGVWRQIAADIFNAEVVTLATAEGAALGAAIHAAYALERRERGVASYDELTNRLVQLDESSRCHPQAQKAELYAELQGKFSGLTSRLREVGYL